MAENRWLYAWGLGSVAFGAASLLVPLYVVGLGGEPFALGLLAASAAVIGAPAAILFGRFADRTGRRRPVVLLSLGGVAVALAAISLLSAIPAVVVANAALWFVIAGAGPVLTLLVVAGVPEEQWNRRIALLNKYQGYGWAGGLVLGAVWTSAATPVFGPLGAQRSLFAVCAMCAALAAGAAARWLPPEPAREVSDSKARRVARVLARSRRNVKGATFVFTPNRLYWTTRAIHPRGLAARFSPPLAAYFIAVVLFFAGFAAFFAPLPLFLDATGFSSGVIFGVYLVSSLGAAAFYARAGELSARYDLRALQTGALGLRGVALPAVALVGSALAATTAGLAVTGIVFAVIGVAWAVIAITATTIVTRLAPGSLRGEALGVYTALSAVAGGIGSVVGGWLAGAAGYTAAFGAAGLLVLAGAGVVAVLRGVSGIEVPAEGAREAGAEAGSETTPPAASEAREAAAKE